MPNELYHWGIKGQRWGFRRFQNEDGSLTPEGELRYNQGKQKLARGKAAEMYKTKKYKARLALKQEKQKVNDAAAIAKTAKKEQAKLNAEDRVIRKKPQNMTDEELRNEVNRLAMELDYQKKSWQVERGKKGPGTIDKLDEFFERPTGRIVAQLGGNIIQQVATQSLNKIIEEKTSTLKKQQIANAKKTGEKIKAETDRINQTAANEKKDFDAAYENTYGKKSDYTSDRAAWEKQNYTNTSSNTSSSSSTTKTKSASEYVSEALKNAKGAAGTAKKAYDSFSNNVNKKVNLGQVKKDKPKITNSDTNKSWNEAADWFNSSDGAAALLLPAKSSVNNVIELGPGEKILSLPAPKSWSSMSVDDLIKKK